MVKKSQVFILKENSLEDIHVYNSKVSKILYSRILFALLLGLNSN